MKPTTALRDIGNHLSNRIRAQLRDAADTCELAGVEGYDVGAMLLSVMLTETAVGFRALSMTEKDFVEACRLAYVNAGPRVEEALAKVKNARQRGSGG